MRDDTGKKKRGRSKIFRSCFRSSATDEGPSPFDDRDSKNGQLGKPVLIAVSGRKGKDFIQDVNLVKAGDVADSDVERPSPSRRRISRIIKAVWFDTAMSKKIRRSSSKSSMASGTSLSSLSSEKTGKSFHDMNVQGRECTDMDDSSSRCSNLFSSSSRAASVVSTSSSSTVNSVSRWLSDQKASSRIDSVGSRYPVSSLYSSILKKPNPIGSSSRSCFDQKKGLSRTDSLDSRRQDSLSLAKPNPINSSSRSLPYQKSSSRSYSFDSRDPVSSTSPSIPLTKPNPERIKSGGNNLNIRVCLFSLLSLFVLVTWGRIFSIFCTSIWFYFVPCCQKMKRLNSVTKADTDSNQYKKTVSMEHHPLAFQG